MKTRFQILTVLATLLVFGSGIWLAKEQMELRMREQVLARYAQELYSISLVHQVTMAESGEILFLEDPTEQLSFVEAISELTGALGVRLYSPQGEFLIASNGNVTEGLLLEKDLRKSALLFPSGSLSDSAEAGEVFWEPILEGYSEKEPMPVREVVLPVHVADADELLGVAQFLFDASDAQHEIEELNVILVRQSFTIFTVGGGVIALILSASFMRINRIHRSLDRSSFALKKANQALALSARTSAVGGVASHLIHGLRNPLAGLRSYLDGGRVGKDELAAAQSAAKRMEAMVDNIVRTLGESESGAHYELSVEELFEFFRSRIEPVARDHQVKLITESRGGRELDNREGNLVLLILENLAQNAIEAAGGGGQVIVCSGEIDGVTTFEVIDNGSGLPETVKKGLFQPGCTSKELGSGLGLAISGQLAASIGAELTLEKSDENGATFCLALSNRNV